jgi:hypothetical protein
MRFTARKERIVARKVFLGLLLVALLLGGALGYLVWRHNALLLEASEDTQSESEADDAQPPQKSSATPSPSSATSWLKVSANSTSSIYLDSAVAKRVGSHIMVWLLRDYNATQYAGGVGYLSSKDQVEVDCAGFRIRRIYSSNHPQAMGAGEFVSSEHGPMSWNSVAQGDTMWRVLNIACLNSTRS